MCLFDVYGMALMVLHQSGAKLLNLYGQFDFCLISMLYLRLEPGGSF